MNPTPLNKCKLFVWDINPDISREDLKNYFGSFGNVLAIYYPPNKPTARFYHCIVAYSKPEYPAKCLEAIKFNNPLNLQITYAKLSKKDQQQAQLSETRRNKPMSELRRNVPSPLECELLPPVSAASFIKDLDNIPFQSCMFCSQRAYFRCNCDRFCCSNSCLRENWDHHYKVCPPILRFSTCFPNSSEQEDDMIPLNVSKFTEVGGHQNNHVAKTSDGKLEPNLTLNLNQLFNEEETGAIFYDNSTIETVLNSCLNQNIKVQLLYTSHGKYFYFAHFIHCRETYDTFLKMEDEINNTQQDPHEEASFGEFIIAYSRKYEKWYRARFLKAVSSGYFAVFFFDYGNIEIVQYISNIERKWLIPTPLLLLKLPDNITSEDFMKEECEAIIKEANSNHVTVRTTNEPSLLLVGLPFWDIKSQIFKNIYQDSNLSEDNDDDNSKEDTTTTSVEDISNALNEERDNNHSIKEKSSQTPIFQGVHYIRFLNFHSLPISGILEEDEEAIEALNYRIKLYVGKTYFCPSTNIYPSTEIKEGVTYLYLHEEKSRTWYRGTPLALQGNSEVISIFAVDTGAIVEVKRSDIIDMPYEFESTPPLCSYFNFGALYLEPNKEQEIISCIKKNLPIGIYLQAKVLNIEGNKIAIEMPLLSKRLIENGLAKRKEV